MANLDEMIAAGDVDGLHAFMIENGLTINDQDEIVPIDNEAHKRIEAEAELFDRRQLARKILLNSFFINDFNGLEESLVGAYDR